MPCGCCLIFHRAHPVNQLMLLVHACAMRAKSSLFGDATFQWICAPSRSPPGPTRTHRGGGTVHVPVNERQSVEALELSPALFQQRHSIRTRSGGRALLLSPSSWSFRPQTKCGRPGSASPWRTPQLAPRSWGRARCLRWLRDVSALVPLQINGTDCVSCRSDSNLTDTWALFPADRPQPICRTRTSVSALPHHGRPAAVSVGQGEPQVREVGTPRGLMWVLLHSKSLHLKKKLKNK